MANDDEVSDETSFDPTFATSGPRRSTFTPPPASAQPPVIDGAVDDDELANALAADLGRVASGAIPIVDQPAADEQAPPSGAIPPTATPTWDAVPAWISAPAPDPAQAVDLPDGPPVRRSLPDEQLLEWVGEAGKQPGATLDVIEELEQQLRLREEEAREFSSWENRMRSLGTPEAIAAVEQARPDFTGVLPSVPVPPGLPTPSAPVTGSFVLPEAPMARWPAPQFGDDVAAPAPPIAAEPVAQAVPLAPPAWDVPAPSPTWSPGPEYDPNAEEPASETPAVQSTLPQPSFADLVDVSAEPTVAPEPVDEPSAAEAAPAPFDWSIGTPAVAPDTAPVADFAPPIAPPPLVPPRTPDTGPDFHFAPAEPEPAADPELVVEPEPLADPEPEQLETDPVVATIEPEGPPPLIEPGGVHGPPILPSQAASRPPLDFESALKGPDPTAEAEDDPEATTSRPFNFNDLLSGALEEEPPARPEPTRPPDAAAEPLFIEPLPVAAGEPVPTDTGSVSVIDQAYEEELVDDVDETDRVFAGLIGPVSVDTSGIAVAPSTISPPSGPISTVRIPDDEMVLLDNEPVRQRVFSLEDSGPEPTPTDHRVGRAARLFWLWFAANSSILSLGLGAAVFAVGMSLRQSIVAVLAGVALSFIPLGLTTLAGKRSGQPTMVVSRATFGVIGNIVPAVLALVTRLFWGAVLLWLLASSVAIVLVGAQLDGVLGERQLLLISLAVAFLIALLVAFAGYPMLARLQLILSVISGALIVGLIAMTWQYVDISAALTVPDGPWLLTITGAVLVFSFVGLVWATSGADLARYQRVGSSGASSMLWATFGATLPSFLLIGYGALLAASDKGIASGFLLAPLDTLALMLPSWYPVPLLAATALSLLSGITITFYSGGFALQAIGIRVRRQWSIVIVGLLLGGLALLLTFGVTGGMTELFRDVATSIAVPTAAWAGIFAAETMIRNRRFESESLLRRGGVYPDVRWANLLGLFLATGVGFGLTSATVSWLSWQGYGFTLLGVPLDSDLAGTDLGVLVALVLGLIIPILTGIPAIRRQEAMRI